MLIITKKYNDLNKIANSKNENSDSAYNWYSVRAKNARGSVIIEFHMSVRNIAGMDKGKFFQYIKNLIKESDTKPNTEKSNFAGDHNYDEFERSALEYLNKKVGEDAFRRVGGNNGKESDIVFRYDNNFWIECKMNPEARGGQFQVKATDKGITLKHTPIEEIDINVDIGDQKVFQELLEGFIKKAYNKLSDIYEKCDRNPLIFFNYISENEQIRISDNEEVSDESAIAYVKMHYAKKNVKYFITGQTQDIENCIIVPLSQLGDAFNIIAVCRFKRYNARVVPGGYSTEVMKMIYLALKDNGYVYEEDQKWYKNYGAVYVKSDKSSFEIKVPKEKTADIGIEGPITLVFDKKDSIKISDYKQSTRKK